MGVAGLWEVLRPAGQVRSLTELAVEDGFNANPNNQRGFRIGIDASIWFFHAAYGREGENPELRTLFFRCCRLLQLPLLPLFVFDGPHRPAVKRGKRVGGNAHWLTQGMKNIIEAFGFEWRIAPGEAEAELAYLNRIGTIDAVLSDDVDNFLFGATMVIRNPSNTLSGNRAHPVKNAQGKDDGNHVVTYTSQAILSDPSVALSRAGTILIGLLSGGDYIPAGLPGCGQKFATGLARAGFGDSLMKAVEELKGPRLDSFLDQWRQDIRNELKTNKSGLLPSKKPSLAASLPDDFPSLPVLMSYADPLTSENTPQKGNHKTPPGVWRNDPDPMKIASLCELYFEWGVKDVIVHRFRTVLWPGVVCRAVRRVIVDGDARQRPPEAEDDHRFSSPIKKISSALSTLQLSSPTKKSQSTTVSDPSMSETFTLSSLIRLTSPASPSSSRSASPSSPTSSTSDESPLLLEVLSQRTHVSTDSTLEYRVLVNPTPLVERAESGVKGLRPPLVGGLFGIDTEDENEDQEVDESGGDDDGEGGTERLETAACAAAKSGTKERKSRRKDPTTPLRLWLPACMIRAAAPVLAEAYEEKAKAREEKKAKRGTRGGRGVRAATGVRATKTKTKTKGAEVANDDDDKSVPGPSTTRKVAGTKTKTKSVVVGGGRRRKPKQASEAQDEAYEYIDLSGGESPCSPDEEGLEENVKGKGKAKTGKTGATKPKTKASAKTSATNTKATTTSTMNEFFNSTKPSTVRPTKAKPSTSRPPAAKKSAPDLPASKRRHAAEEEALPSLLPQSSRPLDLLRTKSKSSAPTDATSKSKSSVPRCEEESSSSSSHPGPSGIKPTALGLTRRLARPAPPANKPLYVELSDTDSDIVVSDFRGPLIGTTVAITAHDESLSVGADKVSSAFESRKGPRRVVEGVIDLIARENEKRTKNAASMLMPKASLPHEHILSAPLGTDPTRSSSKLAHILLPPSGLESEEEEKGSEGDELPTFHRGSPKSRTKKAKAMVGRPAPFPMQLMSESPVSPRASGLGERRGSRHDDDERDGGDVVEIVDVFTTPRGPSPPRSPTLTPSPVNPSLVQASAGPATFVKSKQSKRFPASPTQSNSLADAKPHENTKQRRRVSVDQDAHTSESEGDELCKSPRRSVLHSSPRRVSHARDRAASPTPMRTSRSTSLANHASSASPVHKGCRVSEGRQPQTDIPGSTLNVGRKPRRSDASAISISSDSEDGDDTGLVIDDDRGGREAEANEENLDECVNEDVDGWADRGMILSAPPTPARTVSPRPTDLAPIVAPTKNMFADPHPARMSKFKPAALTVSKVDVRTSSVEFLASAKTRSNPEGRKNVGDAVAVRRAPLLVARSKSNKGRDEDVIDLTSD